MCPNWSRCSARASAFAPASSSTETPLRAGIGTAIAGRMTPGIRRRWRRPAASIAPVLPAETTASASPTPTARTAATRLESGFARTASAGLSAISIRSGASTSGRPCVSRPEGPYSVTSMPSAAASSAPRITSAGALSPPRASTATRGKLRSLEAERFDLAALVGAAGRADAMGALRRAALRADVHPRRLDRVLCAPLVAACLRCFPLGDCHCGRPL